MLDASVVINLNATDSACEILDALGVRVVVVDTVVEELESAAATRDDFARLNDLVAAGAIEVVTLGATGSAHFATLTAGAARDTLDDGEAATIAYALEAGVTVVIDERKAGRICRERFSHLRSACTADLLLDSAVGTRLGSGRLARAVLRALQLARMQVPTHHLAAIVDLIGQDHAACCPSLPQSIRKPLRQTQ